MKKIIWGCAFLETALIIIMMALVVLEKPISDLIFNILFGATLVTLISCIAVERKNIIEGKLENKPKVAKWKIGLTFMVMLITLILMLIINNIAMR